MAQDLELKLRISADGKVAISIDLGDARRDRRAIRLIERLAEQPTASIPGACNGWAETQAAYRLLASDA